MPNKQPSMTAPILSRRIARPVAHAPLSRASIGGTRLGLSVHTPADILALQRTVGNQAVQRLLSTRATPPRMPAPAVARVQRTLYIKGEHKTAKWDADPLFEKMEPKLLDLGISAYGAKKYFAEYFKRGQDYEFKSFEHFAEVFTNRLETIFKQETQSRELATQQKKQNPETKVPRRTVHAFKIARPKWPESYKQQLGVQPGDNIRHIIRNKTLLSKMQSELEELKKTKKPHELLDYYQSMAKYLGVGPQKHYLTQFKAIYETLYLNLGNLFAGSGGINQSIGLVSDKVSNYGKQLATRGETPVDVEDVINKVEEVILAGIKSQSSKSSSSEHFNKGLPEYKTNIINFFDNLWEYWQDTYSYLSEDGNKVLARAADLAPDIDEIGLNLGFDMIDNPQETGAAKQHEILVKLEQILQGPIASGDHSLTKVFKEFLSVSGMRKYEQAPSSSLGKALASQDDQQQVVPQQQQLVQQFMPQQQQLVQQFMPQQQQFMPQQQQFMPQQQQFVPQQQQQFVPQQQQQFVPQQQQFVPQQQQFVPQQQQQYVPQQPFVQQQQPLVQQQQPNGWQMPLLPPLRAVFPGMFPPQNVQLPPLYQLFPNYFQQPPNPNNQNDDM